MKGYVRFLEKKCLILFLSKNIPLQETLLFVACFVCGEWCDKLDENIFFLGGGGGGVNFGCIAALIIVSI